MARQIKAQSDALNFFYKALPLAPDPQQRDACIWYILDTNLEAGNKDFAALLETLIPIWSTPSYFDDLLDKICTTYTTEHNWQSLLKFQDYYPEAEHVCPALVLSPIIALVRVFPPEGYTSRSSQ